MTFVDIFRYILIFIVWLRFVNHLLNYYLLSYLLIYLLTYLLTYLLIFCRFRALAYTNVDRLCAVFRHNICCFQSSLKLVRLESIFTTKPK